MKKLLFILFCLVSFASKSQTFYKVLQSEYKIYEDDKWVEIQKEQPESMFVIINNSKISITNAAKTVIVTYGEVEKKKYDTHEVAMWDSYDNDGKSCKTILKYAKGDDQVQMSIYYKESNIVFIYTIIKSE